MVPNAGRLEAALELIGTSGHMIAALALTTSAQSILLNAFAFLQPCVVAPLHASLQESGLISTANFAVSVVAAPLIGALSELKGRRIAVLVPACVLGLSLVAALLSPSFTALLIWMAIGGVGQGCLMVGLCLAAEVAPPSCRGGYLNIINWVMSCGTVLVSAVAWLVLGNGYGGQHAWRLFLGLSAALPLASGALLAFRLVESPFWLVARGRHAEAKGALLSLAKANGIDQAERPELAQLLDEIERPQKSAGAAAEEGAAQPWWSWVNVWGGGGESGVASGKKTDAPRLDDAEAGGAPSATSPSLAQALGKDGLEVIRSSPALFRTALLNWAEWLLGSFGWAAIVYFTTDAMSASAAPDATPLALGAHHAAHAAHPTKLSSSALTSVGRGRSWLEPAAAATGRLGGATSFGDASGWHKVGAAAAPYPYDWQPHGVKCEFDYLRINLIGLCELVGVCIVHLAIDKPRGPRGLLGGRRGTQFVLYVLAALAVFPMGFRDALGRNGLLAFGMVARAAVTAANSAMWIAAPELYPTRARTTGATTAFVINLLGSLPAASWCYASLPNAALAGGIALANLAAGVLALMLPETAGRRLDDETQ